MTVIVERVAQAFELKGLGSADFLVNDEDKPEDQAKLLEINPRPPASMALSAIAICVASGDVPAAACPITAAASPPTPAWTRPSPQSVRGWPARSTTWSRTASA